MTRSRMRKEVAMLLCKGRGCKYRKVCSRYVIGTGMKNYEGVGDTWIDHCTNTRKFIRIGNADEFRCPMKEDQDEK